MNNENERNNENNSQAVDETSKENKAQTQINLGLVEEARQIAREIKEANEETRQLLERKEKLEAVKILSGKSEAGHIEPEPDPEVEAKERINSELKSLGLSI
jgi:hypothetical protein|tara:strand:+ start:344 stop:649 length:306 start_codon:yes stop_codon:yes gene_type:complete